MCVCVCVCVRTKVEALQERVTMMQSEAEALRAEVSCVCLYV